MLKKMIKNKVFKIISAITGVFAIVGAFCLFALKDDETVLIKAEGEYNINFNTSSTITYQNYGDFGANGYTTTFSSESVTNVTQVTNNGNVYYVPSLTLDLSNLQVTNGVDTYNFNIFSDINHTSSIITFNNFYRENIGYEQDYPPTAIKCNIQLYGLHYSQRFPDSVYKLYIKLEMDLDTWLSNGFHWSIYYYHDVVTCYTDYVFPSGVTIGDYIGTATGNNTYHLLYYNTSVPTSNGLDYDVGYQVGYNAGYDNGLNAGYNQGYNDGSSISYSEGYNVGYTAGVQSQAELIQNAYQDGYNAGVSDTEDFDSNAQTIFAGIANIAMLPLDFFLEIFNWNLLGINLKGLMMSIISIAVVVIVVKITLGAFRKGR